MRAVGTEPARRHPASVAAGSPLGDRGARLAWLALWGSSAFLLLQAANRAPLGLHDTFAGLAAGEPGWLAAVDHTVAAAVGDQGTLVSVLLATVFAAIAAGVLRSGTTMPALVAGIVIALLIWLAGENIGGIFTGHGTDPNTGPLLILLAAAFWPPRSGGRSGAAACGIHWRALSLVRPLSATGRAAGRSGPGGRWPARRQ